MVRNIIGTAVMVGRGVMSREEVERSLVVVYENGRRPIRSAPAKGLTLEHVYYDDY